tara:strand:- start:21 stop:260 length:240 start_codon:yes stop_codon:yes gene_type:complete
MNKTIQIKNTTYMITKIVTGGRYSDCAELEGPRGGIVRLLKFHENGAVRVLKINKRGMPYASEDVWGEEAATISEAAGL